MIYECFQSIVNKNNEILRLIETLNSNGENINPIKLLNICTYLLNNNY